MSEFEEFLSTHNFLVLPTNGGADYAWNYETTGSGKCYPRCSVMYIGTGLTANSSAVAYTLIAGFNDPTPKNHLYINWNYGLKFFFNFGQETTTSVTEGWLKLQANATNALGQLVDKGLGLRIENGHLYGVSYGTEYGEVDLNYTYASCQQRRIEIRHTPNTKIEWFINNSLAGTQDDVDKIPSGVGADFTYLVFSIKKGNESTKDCYLYLMQPVIMGDR